MNKQNNFHKTKYGIFVLFCVYFLLLSTTPAHADDSAPLPTPTPIPSDYKLPYPGLLPDSPLYFLKSFRDNMMGFLIGKPLDKAEFFLLQSDKQVSASDILVTQQKDKTLLAESTFSQGQDYFEEAVDQAAAARKQGVNVHEIAKKLADANEKHFQVLHEIEQQIDNDNKKKFQDERNREDKLTKMVKDLQH